MDWNDHFVGNGMISWDFLKIHHDLDVGMECIYFSLLMFTLGLQDKANVRQETLFLFENNLGIMDSKTHLQIKRLASWRVGAPVKLRMVQTERLLGSNSIGFYRNPRPPCFWSHRLGD